MKIHLIFAEAITDALNGGRMVTSKPVLVRFLRIAPFSAVPSGFAILSGVGHFLEFPLVPSCLLGWVSVSREVYTL